MQIRRRKLSILVLGLALALAATVRAQGPVPEPGIPDIKRRSGLLTRFTVIDPNLPPDPRRDQWYDTRWGDPPNLRSHPNFYPNGGLYGLPWRVKDSRSIYPYFYGSPGRNTLSPDLKRPTFRLASAVFHPFKP